jgi:hypothetical protein
MRKVPDLTNAFSGKCYYITVCIVPRICLVYCAIQKTWYIFANYEHDSLVGQYVILSFTLLFGRGEVLGNELPTTQFSRLGIWCPTLVYNMSCSV